MKLKERIKTILNSFENLFFKNHACLICRKEIPDGTKFSICEKCFSSLDIISGNKCQKCGEKIPQGNIVCDTCKSLNFYFDKSNSFAVYDDFSDKLIKRLKYSSKKYYSEYIAKLMLENKDYFENIDYLCFVPIGKKRRKERGFNQAEEIARNISIETNIPVLNLIEKVGTEKHQAGLTKLERSKNLENTFMLNKESAKKVKNKNIMIIDDVFTTGSTLSECAKTIKQNKKFLPRSVVCYTFAKTRLFSTNNSQNQQNNYIKR